jgi:hypothetical protein
MMWKIIGMTLILALSACGKSKPAPASAPALETEKPPAFKIAEDQRKALERAKQVEQDVQKAAESQQKEIEAATR